MRFLFLAYFNYFLMFPVFHYFVTPRHLGGKNYSTVLLMHKDKIDFFLNTQVIHFEAQCRHLTHNLRHPFIGSNPVLYSLEYSGVWMICWSEDARYAGLKFIGMMLMRFKYAVLA